MQPTILITGAKGQLGQEMQALFSQTEHLKILYHDIDTLDITDEKQVMAFFQNNPPNIIINCAAYTAVDKAESEPDKAYAINFEAVDILSEMAQNYNSWLIHVSTDYVFDGAQNIPYKENDYTNPLSVYGKSKLAGEKILSENDRSIIIRTSWLYSKFGHNIVNTILKLAQERENLQFVFDQVGSPTNAADLARAILKITDTVIKQPENTSISGIYHFANEGICSWYDFACTIVELSNLPCKITPIESYQYPTPAKRPPYSVLNKTKIKSTFGIEIPWWKDSLKKVLSKN